jgi:RimJ/RimL family protein N-acetyltransferase
METFELPCMVTLHTGRSATLALANASDGGELLRFYRAMPEDDRLVLKDDVTTSDWLDRFLAKLRSGEAISVIGRVGGDICGEATLCLTLHGWSRHVGEIRLNVDRAARGQGLGLELARQIVKVAIDRGIDKLVAHMVDGQIAAKRTFEKLGFSKEAELPGHVQDIHGKKHTLLVYADDVSHVWSAMEGLLGDFRPDRATR